MIVDLPAGWPHVLAALVAGPGAWASAPTIAERCHLEEPTAAARCAGLEEAGWLVSFEWEAAQVFTLTQPAAAKLGLELDAEGEGERERWVAKGRPPCRVQGRHGQQGACRPEEIADPGPPPDELAEHREANERYVERRLARGLTVRIDELPYPTICLTGSTTAWWERWAAPGRPLTPAVACSCCNLLPLGRSTVCLRCMRWGWDSFFAAKPARRRTA